MTIKTVQTNQPLPQGRIRKSAGKLLGESLGGGVFGAAYPHPTRPDLVVKVGYGRTASEMRLDGYLCWVDYCMNAGKGNPFVPQILDARMIVNPADPSTVLFVVTMEKLEPLSRFPEAVQSKLLRAIHAECHDGNIGWSVGKAAKAAPESPIGKVGKFLRNLWTHYSEDLHRGNVMVRTGANGYQLVITDPAAFPKH